MNTFKKIKLKNGLKIVLVKRRGLKATYFSMSVGAGTIRESEKNIGAAHFFEHMLFEGTEKYPSSMELGWTLERIGGKSTAWSDRDYVQYSVSVPRESTESGLEYLSQILFHPLISKQTIDTEKKIIIEEYKRKLDNNETEAWEKFMEYTFGQNSYMGRSILGTIKAINALDEKTLRKYFNTYYAPNNMSLSVLGDFEYENILKTIDKFFGNYPSKTLPANKEQEPLPSNQHFSLVQGSPIQAQIVLGFTTGVSLYEKDLWAIKIIRSFLGFGFGSKIIQKLVYDKGISYATAVWNMSYQHTGIFLVSCGVSEQNVSIAVGEILKEFIKLKTQELSKKELNGVVSQTFSEEYYLYDNPEYFAPIISTDLLLKKRVETVEEKEEILKSITSEDIQRVARKYFTPENLYTLVMGNVPKEVKENIQKELDEFT